MAYAYYRIREKNGEFYFELVQPNNRTQIFGHSPFYGSYSECKMNLEKFKCYIKLAGISKENLNGIEIIKNDKGYLYNIKNHKGEILFIKDSKPIKRECNCKKSVISVCCKWIDSELMMK